MRKTNTRISFQKEIWGNIRRWQYLTETTDEVLIRALGLTNTRTLHCYDVDPKNITLGSIDNFLRVNHLTLSELTCFGTDSIIINN